MDSRVFDSKLTNHNIFGIIKDGLKNDGENLKNLIEVKDDVFYVWHSDDNCLLTLNLKNLYDEDAEAVHQKLHLMSPPAFSVERLVSSACGTRLCVWGSRGAVVVDLPARWGKAGLFDGGKDTILCKSYALDERFLYAQGDVRRVHWHPESVSHLLVLISDNTIRLYNIALKAGPKLVKVLNIGPKPSGMLAGRKILESLGDTAVDFTSAPDTDSLLILRGNGNVYIIQCDLDSKTPIPPKLCGPLAMYPPADDNYGEESCSIAVLGGGDTPPVVVIATCGAVLYHCLLLPETTAPDDTQSSINKDGISYSLYVVEAVELNIDLNSEDIHMQHSYPVHLYPCNSNSATYACVHAAGVHTVTLPVIAQLKEFSRAGEDDVESAVMSLCSRGSVASYVVCTHTAGPRRHYRPPLGLAATRPPLPALLVLCHDAHLLTRTIEPYDLEEQLYKELQLKNPALDQEDINSILKERQKLSFSSILQEILTRDVSQPILKLTNTEEPGPKESLEFLTQATLKLRQEYISRQLRALDVIVKKLRGLRTLNSQQHQWHALLQRDIEAALSRSSSLREKCSLAEKHQDDLKYRCSNLIRCSRDNESSAPAVRRLLQALRLHQGRMMQLQERATRLGERARQRHTHLQNWQEEYKKRDIALGKSHSDTISSILQQQTNQISNLIENTKLLKDQLSIV